MKSDNTSAMRQMLRLQEQMHGAESVQAARALCNLGVAYSDIDDVTNAERSFERACQIYEKLKDAAGMTEANKLLADVRCRMTGELEMDLSSLTLSHFHVPVYVRPGASPGGDATHGTNGDAEKTPASYVEDVKSFLADEEAKTAPEEAMESLPGEEEEDKIAEPEAPPSVSQEQLEQQKKLIEEKRLDDAIRTATIEVAQLKKRGSGTTNQLADVLVELAGLHSKKNDPEKMESCLLEALQIRESVYGKNHLSVSTDLKNLGRMYFAIERFDDAEKSWKRSLAIREAQLGPYHPQVADIASLYAKLLRKLEVTKEAEELESRVEESKQRHPSDWEYYKKAALKAMEVDNYFYAQALWLAAMEEATDFEDEDPRLLVTLENLAHVYWRRERYQKAEPLCKRIYKVSEKLLGKDHIDVARAAKNLALVCDRQGKYTEAAVLYQESVRIMEGTLGADHPDVEEMRDCHANAIQFAHKQLEQKLQKSL